MPIITKPSEALKLALSIMTKSDSPWTAYNTDRGSHRYTCNCIDYLQEAEEITDEAGEAALEALKLNSQLDERYGDQSLISTEKLRRIGWFNTHADRINAINKTIEELEAKGE